MWLKVLEFNIKNKKKSQFADDAPIFLYLAVFYSQMFGIFFTLVTFGLLVLSIYIICYDSLIFCCSVGLLVNTISSLGTNTFF